jgi:DNA-binding transcriptional ArsR family regulator
MSSIFPLRDTVTPDEDREPRLVDLDEDTADEVFEALSSGTTRSIFLSLHQNPQTASDLADTTDTSVQNVQYHLGKLKDAELVEVVDTWYSERGTEMKVYAPQDDSLVLFAGRDKQSTLRNLLNRIAGVLTLLVPASVIAGVSAHWSSGTESGGDPGVVVDTADQTDTRGVTENGGGADTGTSPDSGGDDGSLGTDASDDGGLEMADRPLESATEAEGVVVTDNDTAYVFDNETAWEVDNATVSNAPETPGNGSQFLVEGEPGRATNETVFLVRGETDPGSNVTLPVEAVDSATDTSATIAGMDPAVAVGLSVLVGGLLVAGGLAAWYGVPGLSSDAGADGTS